MKIIIKQTKQLLLKSRLFLLISCILFINHLIQSSRLLFRIFWQLLWRCNQQICRIKGTQNHSLADLAEGQDYIIL